MRSQADILEDGVGAGVGKADVVESDFVREGCEELCSGLFGVFFVEIEIREDLRAGALGGLELLVDGAHAFKRGVGLEEREDEREEHAEGHHAMMDLFERE